MSQRDKNINLATFFGLYIAQTIPMSFLSTIIPVLMRQDSFSLSTIALLQLIKLPWIIKFLWAPVVDRTTSGLKSYKRYIFTSEIIYAALIFAVSFLDFKADFNTIIPLIIIAFLASATQDIATDALAVRCFNKQDKSLVNSMQSMGSFAGSIVGSGILLFMFHRLGWSQLLPWVALFVLVALIPLKLNKTLELNSRKEHTRAKRADFIHFFRQKGIWKQVGFLILCYSGIMGILTMLKPYMVDLGYNIEQIGFISGIVGTGTAVASSWFGGVIVKKIGRYESRIIFAITTIITAMWFVVMSFITTTLFHIYVGVMLIWGSYGFASIIVYTTAMDCVREGREGTDFTIQTVVTHFSSMIIAIASGKIADTLGYKGLFISAVVISFIYLCYVKYIFQEPKLEDNE